MRTSPDVASVLADLTTVNDGGKCFIPTGSPASQLVAYFSYRNMFDELKRHADRCGCRFSLYVDDLTISSRSPISDPHFLVELMAKAMRAYGRRLKREKVKYRGARDNKVVTGVAIDQKSGETCCRKCRQLFDYIHAIADRLCHHCALIKITRRSYRLKDVSLGGDDGKEGKGLAA